MADAMYKYTFESINKCKDFVKFLQKRQQIEIEYSKALGNFCIKYLYKMFSYMVNSFNHYVWINVI